MLNQMKHLWLVHRKWRVTRKLKSELHLLVCVSQYFSNCSPTPYKDHNRSSFKSIVTEDVLILRSLSHIFPLNSSFYPSSSLFFISPLMLSLYLLLWISSFHYFPFCIVKFPHSLILLLIGSFSIFTHRLSPYSTFNLVTILYCISPSSFSLIPSRVIKWVCYPIYTHTNPWGKLKWPYAITRLAAHFICGLMSDLVICNFRKDMVIHDTECPYWHQVSINNTNQTFSLNFWSSCRHVGLLIHFQPHVSIPSPFRFSSSECPSSIPTPHDFP